MLLFTTLLKDQQQDVCTSRHCRPVLAGLIGIGGAVTFAATRGSQRTRLTVLTQIFSTEGSRRRSERETRAEQECKRLDDESGTGP